MRSFIAEWSKALGAPLEQTSQPALWRPLDHGAAAAQREFGLPTLPVNEAKFLHTGRVPHPHYPINRDVADVSGSVEIQATGVDLTVPRNSQLLPQIGACAIGTTRVRLYLVRCLQPVNV